jgi:hypothetical protein
MKQKCIPAASAVMLTAGWLNIASAQSSDDAAADRPMFTLFDSVEQATGIKVSGFTQVGVSRNNTSTHDQAMGGHSNFPVVGPSDEGLQLNAVQLAFEKQTRSNILPRITPLPGPVPWEFSWGFRGEVLYGRNGLPAGMVGFDSNLGVNRTPTGVAPGSNRQNYVAFPQAYAEFYFPVAQGMTLMVGRFGSGVGRDIPPEWRPGPNFFYSKTYAFVSQPDQVAGALFSANILRNDTGFLAGELGVVNGRQNWKDNNSDKSIIGALRWRSGDMQTWVDYSFMRGNEQNNPGAAPQMPIARLISPRGQLREHHSLSFTANPADAWQVKGEVLYGKQAGDGKPDTIDILSGPFYTGGKYSGINAQVHYRTSANLQYGVRAEKFRDRKGTALFPVTAVPGDFNALTAGLRYDLNKNVVFRPEIRYDWQSGNHGIKAFGGGTANKQTTLSADVIVYF